MHTILLIIESEVLRIALSHSLSQTFDVITCSPSEADQELRWRKPDALVLDLFLSGTNGFSLLMECKAFLPPTVLMLTTFISPSIWETAAELGVNFIVRTPVRLTYVRDLLLDTLLFHADKNHLNDSSIRVHLQSLGISPTLSGYHFLRTAITLFSQNPCQLLKELYPHIAKIFGTSSQAVEKNIRTAIRHAWNHRQEATWKFYFPYLRECPSNKEFIAALSELYE